VRETEVKRDKGKRPLRLKCNGVSTLGTTEHFVLAVLVTVQMKWFKDHFNIEFIQGWGMTETSPLCTLGKFVSKSKHLDWTEEERFGNVLKAGILYVQPISSHAQPRWIGPRSF
jgi:acyl-CoA synthetase (AMP-forming)/AMP-acid ligase II